MLFHLSIEADDPARVAHVLAELWGGEAYPFPSVAPGSWMAFAPADDGTMIEVYPRGTRLAEAEGGAAGIPRAVERGTATHFAISTPHSAERVHAIAAREGWPVQDCRRGAAFGVIELWIEGCQMVELLTEEMQAEYRAAVTIEGWRAMLAALPETATV